MTSLGNYPVLRITLSVITSILLGIGYYLILRSQILDIEFSFFRANPEIYTELTLRMAVVVTVGFILAFLVKTNVIVTLLSSPISLLIRIMLLLIIWFSSFATFYSYQPSRLLLNLDFSVLQPLSVLFTPITSFFMVFILLTWWSYQMDISDITLNSPNTATFGMRLARVIFNFLFALLLTIPLGFVVQLLVPDYGEGSIGPILVCSGLLGCYLMTRIDLAALVENRDQIYLVRNNLIFRSPTNSELVFSLVFELFILLLVLVPGFALMGTYITDSSLNTPFDNSFIVTSLLFSLPFAFWSVIRFDRVSILKA